MGLDTVELLIDVEDEFGISVQDKEAYSVQTVAEFVLLIHSKAGTEQEVIYHKLVQILVSNYGVDINLIEPNAHITNDLGLN